MRFALRLRCRRGRNGRSLWCCLCLSSRRRLGRCSLARALLDFGLFRLFGLLGCRRSNLGRWSLSLWLRCRRCLCWWRWALRWRRDLGPGRRLCPGCRSWSCSCWSCWSCCSCWSWSLRFGLTWASCRPFWACSLSWRCFCPCAGWSRCHWRGFCLWSPAPRARRLCWSLWRR